MPFYPLEVLIEAERRQIAAAIANSQERAAANQRNARRYRLLLVRRHLKGYRLIAQAMDLVTANLWRGKRRSVAALLLFERQWRRERECLRLHGFRVSGYDAVEQFVRCIRLWRVAGVL